MPYRGKDNEPSYIIHTVKKLSEIKKLSNESIMFNTTNYTDEDLDSTLDIVLNNPEVTNDLSMHGQ